MACHNGIIHPLYIHSPVLHHLPYADDLLLVVKSNIEAVEGITNIIDNLGKYAGLQLNTLKTKCYFNKFCKKKQSILDTLDNR